jgi:hypothetical protein
MKVNLKSDSNLILSEYIYVIKIRLGIFLIAMSVHRNAQTIAYSTGYFSRIDFVLLFILFIIATYAHVLWYSH